jgi:hypothetical protein
MRDLASQLVDAVVSCCDTANLDRQEAILAVQAVLTERGVKYRKPYIRKTARWRGDLQAKGPC